MSQATAGDCNMTPLATIAALNLAAAISPGPAFVLVTKTAATSNRSSALKAAMGTAAASVIWATAAILGVEVILTRVAGIYRGLQLLGGLYLCFLGVAMWRHAPESLPTISGEGQEQRGAFKKGLLLGLSNPKVVVFFGTIFTTAFGPETPAVVKWAALPLVLCNESVWYGSLALCFGSSPIRSAYRRVKKGLERTFGIVLVTFGAKIAWNGVRVR
jgi:threonine efflux protein